MQVVLSVTVMLVDLSVRLIQVTVSAANIWVTIFVVIMQVEVSVAIMQVLFCAMHYVHDCFYCNCAGNCFCYSNVGDSFSNNFIFLSLTPTFHTVDQKTFEGIISDLHFTIFVNILSKLKYF